MNKDTSHLDLPIVPGQRQKWAEELAEPPPIKDAGTGLKLFVVRLGSEWFGFPPSMLVATQPDVRATRLPHRADSNIEGLVNADGRVLPCLALERIFQVLPGEKSSDVPRLLVFHLNGWTFAARARQVAGVEEVPADNLQPLGESASENLRRCAKGLIVRDGQAIVCLDAEGLFNHLITLVR